MSDCIFCKIVAGEIPSYTVYEDEHTLAFLDAFPRSKGHTLVIPKKHGVTLFDYSDEEMADLMKSVHTATKRVFDVIRPDGCNIGWNHGAAGGQAVDHLHVHIMPRWSDDEGTNMHAIVDRGEGVDVEEVAKLFKNT